MSEDSFSLYVHIPYCLHKCPYCDFNTYAVNNVPEREYSRALLAEFDNYTTQEHWKDKSIRTIYFGGGTPALFSGKIINELITAFCSHLSSTPVEITIEANPGAITHQRLAEFYSAGINRISFGAQSFLQKNLLALGRIHTPKDIELSVEHARQAGFKNINLDLMFGIPGQSIKDLEEDLESYIELAPEHISAYGLTIEKGTPFYQRFKKGEMTLPSEDEMVEMIELVNSKLFKRLYHRYEISNFSKEGFEAIHNVAYWEGREYMGLGAGAHSYLLQMNEQDHVAVRRANVADPKIYLEKAMSTGEASAWQEGLTQQDAIFETFFLALRTEKGVQSKNFKARFGMEPLESYPELINKLQEEDLLSVTNEYIKLTDRGILLSDSVIEQFADLDLIKPVSYLPNKPVQHV